MCEPFSLLGMSSTQYGTTFVKKLIEDNCTMEETIRFFAVHSIVMVVFTFVCDGHSC